MTYAHDVISEIRSLADNADGPAIIIGDTQEDMSHTKWYGFELHDSVI